MELEKDHIKDYGQIIKFMVQKLGVIVQKLQFMVQIKEFIGQKNHFIERTGKKFIQLCTARLLNFHLTTIYTKTANIKKQQDKLRRPADPLLEH